MLKALTPPQTKRGAVLIDPSYEETRDYSDAADTILAVHKKWSNGIIMLWYPLLVHREGEINAMLDRITEGARLVNQNVELADLRLEDIPDENNYYFMHLYRNGVGYRWAVMSDRENPGAELQQLFSCTTKRDMDAGTGSDVLFEGDQMRLEVRSIDRPVYDYLYSLQLMNNTGTNPIANFSDGLLGYFSAYQVDVRDIEFCVDSIR